MKTQDMLLYAAGGLALFYLLQSKKTTPAATSLPYGTLPATPGATSAAAQPANLLTSLTKLFSSPSPAAAASPTPSMSLTMPAASSTQSVADQQAAATLQNAINQENMTSTDQTAMNLQDSSMSFDNSGDFISGWWDDDEDDF